MKLELTLRVGPEDDMREVLVKRYLGIPWKMTDVCDQRAVSGVVAYSAEFLE